MRTQSLAAQAYDILVEVPLQVTTEGVQHARNRVNDGECAGECQHDTRWGDGRSRTQPERHRAAVARRRRRASLRQRLAGDGHRRWGHYRGRNSRGFRSSGRHRLRDRGCGYRRSLPRLRLRERTESTVTRVGLRPQNPGGRSIQAYLPWRRFPAINISDDTNAIRRIHTGYRNPAHRTYAPSTHRDWAKEAMQTQSRLLEPASLSL